MARESRFGDRHPLCTCPIVTQRYGLRRIAPQPDCPGGSIAHPPAVTLERLREALPYLRDPHEMH